MALAESGGFGDLGGWAHFDHVEKLEIQLDSEWSYALHAPSAETMDVFLSLSVMDRQAFQLKRRQILTAVAHFFEERPKLTAKMSFLSRFLGSAGQRSLEGAGSRSRSHQFIEALLQKIDGLFLQQNILSLAHSKDMELYTGLGFETAAGTPQIQLGQYSVSGFALGGGLAAGCEFAVELSRGGRLCLKSFYLDFELVRKAFLPTLLATLNGRMAVAGSPELGSRQGRFFERIQTYYIPGGPVLLRNERIFGGGLALGLSVPPVVSTAASFEVVTYRFKLPLAWGKPQAPSCESHLK